MGRMTTTAAAGLALAALTTALPTGAGAAVLEQTFDDPTASVFDQFGNSVALSGDRVLIGARGDDTQGSDVGQAHLFDATAVRCCRPSTTRR